MTEPTGPRHVLTRAEAIQLRALGRMGKARAGLEPDLYLRGQQMKVANAAIAKAEEVLNAEPQNEKDSGLSPSRAACKPRNRRSSS